MNLLARRLLFFFLASCPHFLHCQELEIRTYSTLDGLTENQPIVIYQDHFGYLWLGSIRGLTRFDGQSFRQYGIQHGMPSLFCNTVFEDRQGRMWIGTRNGIAEFRRDSFFIYENTDQKKITYVFQLYENIAGQFIANTTEGQYRFDGKQWHPYADLPQMHGDILAWTIVTPEGEYYDTGFTLYFKARDGEPGVFFEEPNRNYPLRFLQYVDHRIIANLGSQFLIFDTMGATPLFPQLTGHYPHQNAFKDSYGRWWLTSLKEGILVFQNEKDSIPTHVIDIPFKEISSSGVFEDQQKQVWYTTSAGLQKVFPPCYEAFEIKEVSTPYQVRNFIPVRKNEFLLSISDGSLLHIRYGEKTKQPYEVLDRFVLDVKGDFVDYFAIGPSEEIWMTTRSAEMYRLKQGRLTNMSYLIDARHQPFAEELVFLSSGEMVIAMDSILVAGNANKVDTLFDDAHTYISFPRQVKRFGDDKLIVKTLQSDIYILASDETGKRFFKKLALPASWQRQIRLDGKDNMWIYNTGQNISRYTFSDTTPQMEEAISESEDNVNVLLHDFLVDSAGTIWGITSRGIQHIYKNEAGHWNSDNYFVREIGESFPEWFKLVETEDRIWVNMKNRLIYLDKHIPPTDQPSRNVILEDVKLNNQLTDWKTLTDSVYSYFEIPYAPTLKYNQNALTFFYNSPYTDDRQGQVYSFRLLPVDTTWSVPSTNKSTAFNQLKPDSYFFQVRCRSLGKAWGNVMEFPFVIQKPFWDQWWFRLLLLLSTASLVLWMFQLRLRQERAKGEIKTQLLELEMRALRAQMNPHFIYNALNSIQSLVATNQSSAANRYISTFARLLRQVLENSRKSEITVRQELESLRLYVELEQLRMDSQVDFLEMIDDEIMAIPFYMPPLILQPFVENAFWHGLSSRQGEKHIELEVSLFDTFIQFVVTDNGIGRKQAALNQTKGNEHASAAMEITTQRLRDFNGQLTIQPVTVEDIYDSTGHAGGTRVVIRIRKKVHRDPLE